MVVSSNHHHTNAYPPPPQTLLLEAKSGLSSSTLKDTDTTSSGSGPTHESLPHLHPQLHHFQPRVLTLHMVVSRNKRLVTFSLIYPMFKAICPQSVSIGCFEVRSESLLSKSEDLDLVNKFNIDSTMTKECISRSSFPNHSMCGGVS